MGVFQNFKQIIKKQELDIQRLYNQACAHIQENSFEAAEQNLKQIQSISNKDIRWMRGFGHLFHYKGNATLSYHWYMQAAQYNDDLSFYHLGQIEFDRHNYTLAKHYLQSAIGLGNSLALVLIGKISLYEYQLHQAITYLQQAILCNHNDALIPLGQTYILLKQYLKAEKYLAQACNLEIKSSAHYFAQVKQYTNELELAKNWYIYSFQTEKNISSLELFGQVLCAEGKILEGETILSIAHKLEDNTTLSAVENTALSQIMGTDAHFKLNL